MTELVMPLTASDLPRPFERIGETGWADRARDVLRSYDAPVPEPSSLTEVEAAEARLHVSLPAAYRRFLLELGPIDVDAFRFLPPDEVDFLGGYGAKDFFSASDAALLSKMLSVVEYLGSDRIALHSENGRCARSGHDPPGFSNWLPSFDNVVQVAFLNLPVGYHGWSDRNLDELVKGEQERLFGTAL